MPCPCCFGEEVDMESVDGRTLFYCARCGVSGPWGKNRNKAVKRWNNMPRRLRWTPEPPTLPGTYWFKYDNLPAYTLTVCYDNNVLSVLTDDLDYIPVIDYTRNGFGYWAGPVQEPSDLTVEV